MQRTYLIQRLQKPYEVQNDLTKLGNVFSFGGGLRNGGLSKEAKALLSPLFRFDYMGSAEFEYGAIPKSFSNIVTRKDEYVEFIFPVQYKCKNWKEKKTYTGKVAVYVICKKLDKIEVIARLEKFAKTPFNDTKERISFDESLAEFEYHKDIIGWLEIDNDFLFFKDIETGKKTANLLLRS